MIHMSDGQIWFIIGAMALGTFLIRLSFLGLVGNRPLPPWLLRHLRYTPVAVIPGLVAPLVLWPEATGGEPDPARLAAAAVTLGVGALTRNTLVAILSGAATLYVLLALLS
jgi:branched-subunit amino acid transport protein